MKRGWWASVFLLAGCSTHPAGDILDYFQPGKLYPDGMEHPLVALEIPGDVQPLKEPEQNRAREQAAIERRADDHERAERCQRAGEQHAGAECVVHVLAELDGLRTKLRHCPRPRQPEAKVHDERHERGKTLRRSHVAPGVGAEHASGVRRDHERDDDIAPIHRVEAGRVLQRGLQGTYRVGSVNTRLFRARPEACGTESRCR